MNVVITIAAFWFAAYMAAVIALFGLPDSLSESHYRWTGMFPKAGRFIFPLWLTAFVWMLIPAVLDMTEGTSLQIVAFLMLASLLFVAVCPWFKENDCGSTTHYTGAYSSALFGCTFSVIYGDWRFPAFFAVMAIGAIISDRTRYVLYLEMSAFLGIICCIMQ